MSKSIREIIDNSIKVNYETQPLDKNDSELASNALKSCIRASVLLEANNGDRNKKIDLTNETSNS